MDVSVTGGDATLDYDVINQCVRGLELIEGTGGRPEKRGGQSHVGRIGREVIFGFCPTGVKER